MESPEKADEMNVELAANYEGNAALLLFSRLHNPIIRRQLIDLYIKAGLESEEKIEKKLDSRLKQEEDKTYIEFSDDEPYSGSRGAVITMNWCFPLTSKKPTPKMLSIIEAHEKGHHIRFGVNYEDYLSTYFSRALDMAGVTVPKEQIELLKEYERIQDKTDQDKTDDEFLKEWFQYLLSPHEIAERMSQIKNYFGFSGSEKLTKEQLDYAKKHYVEDTGSDNGMSVFFQAITSDTEDAFLEIINNSGI